MSDWTEKIKAAHEMVSALCRPRGSVGSREWIMSIPARPDYDPDIVITSGLMAAEARIAELVARAEAAEATLKALVLAGAVVPVPSKAEGSADLVLLRDACCSRMVRFKSRVFYPHEDGYWYELCSAKSFPEEFEETLVEPVDLVPLETYLTEGARRKNFFATESTESTENW